MWNSLEVGLFKYQEMPIDDCDTSTKFVVRGRFALDLQLMASGPKHMNEALWASGP